MLFSKLSHRLFKILFTHRLHQLFNQILLSLLTIALILSNPISQTTVFAFKISHNIDIASQNSLPNSPQKLEADKLLQQGIEEYKNGKIQEAIKSWQLSENIYKQLGETHSQTQSLLYLGSAYVSTQRYKEAINSLQSALPFLQSQQDNQGEGQALANLGIAYRNIGNYPKAIQLQQKAAKIYQKLGDKEAFGKVLLNLGNSFSVVGDYEKATIAYQQSLKISQQLADKPSQAIGISNLGKLYSDTGKYQEAIKAYEDSLVISRSIQDIKAEASTLINLGATYHIQGDNSKASPLYEQALKLAANLGDKKIEAEANGSLGLLAEESGDYNKAIEYQQKAANLAKAIGDIDIESLALNNLGHVFFSAAKLTEAEAKLRQAINLLDNLRPGLSDKYKVSIFDTQIYSYNLLQQILLAANKPEAALEISEQGRARAFIELLAKRVYLDKNSSNSSNSSNFSKPNNSNQPNNSDVFSINTVPNIEKIRQIAKQQKATLVEYSFVPDDNFKFRGKQRAREQELLIWVVQPNGKVISRHVDLKPFWQKGGTFSDAVRISRCLIINPRAKCSELVQPFRELRRSPKGVKSTKSEDFRKLLHQYLIQPIADLLPKNPSDHIIFIPQESLFTVPFPALQDEEGKYLVQKHTILTAPAIQVLDFTKNLEIQRNRLRKKTSIFTSPSSALIVGNPVMPKIANVPGETPEQLPTLPEAEKEAKDIAKFLNTQAIIGAKATKENILSHIQKARLVHMATHGLLEYGINLGDLGIPGALALTPADKDDGLLKSEEIIQQKLNAELVVLSACSTGEGRISGDGVIGLSRSFLIAGTESLIVSLWVVPDLETSKMMRVFYQYFKKNPDKAAALRQGMLEILKENSPPVSWAAFTLIGNSL
jgi:CHAT domain-containing protein/tetratricopeptide (TPR) repeat protein